MECFDQFSFLSGLVLTWLTKCSQPVNFILLSVTFKVITAKYLDCVLTGRATVDDYAKDGVPGAV